MSVWTVSAFARDWLTRCFSLRGSLQTGAFGTRQEIGASWTASQFVSAGMADKGRRERLLVEKSERKDKRVQSLKLGQSHLCVFVFAAAAPASRYN